MARKPSSASIYNWEAKTLNNATLIMYADMLANVATTVFKWSNLPDSINERFIERTLFNNGNVIFFNDDVFGLLALSGSATAPLNVYGEPQTVNIYAANGYTQNITDGNFVIVYNNYSRNGDSDCVQLYARRIYEAERTCDINIIAQKTPVMITCDNDKQLLTLRNVVKNYSGNEPFIYAREGVANSIKPHKVDSPFIADKVTIIKRQILAEAYSYFGVESNAVDKKERLVEAEVESANVATRANLYARLKSRQEAVEKINKKFKTNIRVEVNAELMDSIVFDEEINSVKEGEIIE